jgi:arylsulfatase A-like enzyme
MKDSNKLNRRNFLKLTGIGAVIYSTGIFNLNCIVETNPDSRPNIVLIMADDMGFSDTGCFGGEVITPNLDRLAENGLRFTQFYNCARCCPTRASLLTGLYPHQVGMARNGQNLNHNNITIAEALKSAGYLTGMVGKWHLSHTKPLDYNRLHQKWLDHQYDPGLPFSPLETYPTRRGFDKYYGVIWGVINYFDPFSLVDGMKPVKEVPEDFYFTDAITDKAIKYIQEFSRDQKPFFLYISHCAPHWPLHALPEDIQKYKGTYTDGWTILRQRRFQRQQKMGLFDRENTVLPDIQDGGLKWDKLSREEKEFQASKMSVHAAMVDKLDQSTGRILDALKTTAQLDNTLIFFLSDNGASPEIPQRPGFDRNAQTRDGKEIKYQGIYNPGTETTYTGIGPAWSSASNTPYRFWKKESFEGGCHTPLIVHWPKGLKSIPGSTTDQVGHVADILPTCLEIAGAKYPTNFNGNPIPPLEGKSLLPVFEGKQRQGHEILFFEHMGGKAVRIGEWKLVALNLGVWELYNLSQDKTEMNNLAEKFPQKVEDMKKEWLAWSKRVNVPPPPAS